MIGWATFTPGVLVLMGLSLVVGVALGWLLRGAQNIALGREAPPSMDRTAARRALERNGRIIAIVVLLVCVVLTTGTTLYQVSTAVELRERAANVSARAATTESLAVCVAKLSEAQNEALKARNAPAESQLSTSIDLWTGLRDELAKSDEQMPDLSAVVGRIDAYVATLRESQQARSAVPYPPSNLCSGPTPRAGKAAG